MNMIRDILNKLGKPYKVFNKQNCKGKARMIVHIVAQEDNVFDKIMVHVMSTNRGVLDNIVTRCITHWRRRGSRINNGFQIRNLHRCGLRTHHDKMFGAVNSRNLMIARRQPLMRDASVYSRGNMDPGGVAAKNMVPIHGEIFCTVD